MDWFSVAVVVVTLFIVMSWHRKSHRSKQLKYIKSYSFDKPLKDKISEKYPHLSSKEINQVFRALRDYFWMCNTAKRKMVAMPSQVVDDAWHEFILFTRSYQAFCKKGLGRFLYHTPTQAMSSPTIALEGIKRAWRLACAKEKINPRVPKKLPLIFEIDSILNIQNGFKYSLNCKDKSSPENMDGYCAGHIGCSSGCAGDSGSSSDSDGLFDGLFDSSGGGSDCGGGCGGD